MNPICGHLAVPPHAFPLSRPTTHRSTEPRRPRERDGVREEWPCGSSPIAVRRPLIAASDAQPPHPACRPPSPPQGRGLHRTPARLGTRRDHPSRGGQQKRPRHRATGIGSATSDTLRGTTSGASRYGPDPFCPQWGSATIVPLIERGLSSLGWASPSHNSVRRLCRFREAGLRALCWPIVGR